MNIKKNTLKIVLIIVINVSNFFSVWAQGAKIPELLKQKSQVFFLSDELFLSCVNSTVNLLITSYKERNPKEKAIIVVDLNTNYEAKLIPSIREYYDADTIITDNNHEISSAYNVPVFQLCLELDSLGHEIRRYDGLHISNLTETVKLRDSIAKVQEYHSIFVQEKLLPLSRASDAKINKSLLQLYVSDNKMGSVAIIDLNNGIINQYTMPDFTSTLQLYKNQLLPDSAFFNEIKRGRVFLPRFHEFVCDTLGKPVFLNADYVKEIVYENNRVSNNDEDVVLPVDVNVLRNIGLSNVVEINPINYNEKWFGSMALLSTSSSSFITEVFPVKKKQSPDEDIILGRLNYISSELEPILTKKDYKKATGVAWKMTYNNQSIVSTSSSQAIYCSMFQPCLLLSDFGNKPFCKTIPPGGELKMYFDSLRVWRRNKTPTNQQYSMRLIGMTVENNQLFMGFTQANDATVYADDPLNEAVYLQKYNLSTGKFKEWDITPLLVDDNLLQVRFAGILNNDAIFLYKWSIKRWEIRKIPLQALEKIVTN